MGVDTTSSVSSSRVRALFSFPNPVNEVSARLVAAGVVLMCVLTIALDLRWATAVIAYGFVARVLTGPTLSPLGQFVTRVVTPRLGLRERPVAGPPKRFAQAIGVAFSVTALVLTGAGLLDGRRGRPRPPRRSRPAGVRLRALPRLQGLCGAHARRRGARGCLRALQRHLGHPQRGGIGPHLRGRRQGAVSCRR